MKEILKQAVSAITNIKVSDADMEDDEVLISIIHDRDGNLSCRVLGRDSDIIATLSTVAVENPKFYKLLKTVVVMTEEWKQQHDSDKGNKKITAMYAETDSNGYLSIMEIKREEAIKLKRILQEFEFLFRNYTGDNPVGSVEAAGMVILSATVRFQLTDAMKCKEK